MQTNETKCCYIKLSSKINENALQCFLFIQGVVAGVIVVVVVVFGSLVLFLLMYFCLLVFP